MPYKINDNKRDLSICQEDLTALKLNNICMLEGFHQKRLSLKK